MNNIKKETIFSGFIWRFLERCGAQGVKFAVELVLARLLVPDDYGLIALVTIFIEVLNVFVDSGMGNALIQKKDADDLDFSSVFYFNMVLCILLYTVLFLSAPLISGFYGRNELTMVLRILGLQVIISGVKNVQQAYVSRTLQFKFFFFATLCGTIGAAILGIYMAYCGYGVWALVAQQLFNTTIDTIILWIVVKWRPKPCFSIGRLKRLISFGWKLLLSSLLDTTFNQVRQLIIGKMYTTEDLAYYNRGQQFPQFFVNNINSAIGSVLLSAMANVQDNIVSIRNMTQRAIKTSTYLMAPLMIGLVTTAPQVVSIVLTDKWLPCVPFLRIICITYIFYPIHTANLNAIKAMGRSDLFLILEIWKKVIGMILLLGTMRYGVMAMAYSLLASSVIGQIINSWPNRKLLNYNYLDQLKDIFPNILLAIAMGCCVYLVAILNLPDIILLLIQIVVGMVFYVTCSVIFKLDSFVYLWNMAKKYINKSNI